MTDNEATNEKLQCYNRSCGQVFLSSENNPDSCLHHSGVPVFHDAYKKWSCCDKKTTDFTEFLNIKGCTRSYHSNIKPPEIPKPSVKCDKNEEIRSLPQPLSQKQVVERPDSGLPMIKLPFTVGTSLQPLLDKMQNEIVLHMETENDLIVQLNTPCHNGGCHKTYAGENSNEETCLYHSGVPIFHEGLKYWSCCVKRTTDFDSFLEQVGCTTGNHKWHKEKNQEANMSCRYDWHQTGNFVIVSVYSKCPLPNLSYVEANPVKLHIRIVFGKEKNLFEEQIVLFGVVDVASCTVSYLGSKVEIKMKKAEPASWKDVMFREKILDIKSLNLKEN